MSHQFKLFSEIVKLSVSDNWPEAVREWKLDTVYEAEEPDTCLCGHTPIREICVLRNYRNGNYAEVGNHCVHRFTSLPSNLIFDGMKRIIEDDDKAANLAVIDYSAKKGWINSWERGFLNNTKSKRNLSVKQAVTRQQINAKIIQNFRSKQRVEG